MAPLRNLLFAMAFIAFSMSLLPSQNAHAQGTSIITYDQARVMRDSAGGKDLAQKLKAIGDSMKTELESEGRSLETEGKSLETRTANLTREALQADSSLRGQLEAFGRKRATFQQKGQIRQAEMSQTEQNAWADFFKALQPVLDEVARERGAQIILKRSTIAYGNANLDVTDTVISKMNARKPTVTVTRARIQAPPQTVQ